MSGMNEWIIKDFETFLGIPFCEHHLRDTRGTYVFPFLQKVGHIRDCEIRVYFYVNMHNNVRKEDSKESTHKNVFTFRTWRSASQLFPSFFGGEVGEGKRDGSALKRASVNSTKE